MRKDMPKKQKLPLPQGYTRKFETEDFLVQRLVARGLKITSEDELRKILRVIGYYRLTGYLYPFRKAASDDYAQGTTLDKVWRLYSFDRRLRLLVTDALARIEVAVRARVMECHSLAFGGNPFAYCDPLAMPSLKQTQFDEFEEFVDRAILQAKNANDPAVAHHVAKFGNTKTPVWMLMENLSFGDVVRYYRGCPKQVQMQIANGFGVWPGLFNNWLDILRRVRNTCAHHGRLWNRKINYPISYNFSKAAALADLYACVSIQMSLRHTTLFSVMSLCAWLLRQVRPESQWRERVKTLLDDYSDVSLSAMGFPDDWREYALWK